MTKATTLTIDNFRAIEHVEVALHDLTVITGRNNAGKSTLLEALRLLYKDRAWDEDGDRPHGDKSAACRIRLDFGDETHVQLEVEAGGKPSWTDGSQTSTKPLGHVADGDLVFIPSQLRLDDVAKNTASSPFTKLIATAVSGAVAEGSKVAGHLAKARDELVGDERLRSVFAEFEDRLAGWEIALVPDVRAPSAEDIVKQWMGLSATDNGREVSVDQLGSGAQRAIAFAMIQTLAATASDDEFESPRLLLFEEPEAFLHPGQIDALRRDVEELAAGDYQPIVTTHSPRFLAGGLEKLSTIARLHRDGGVTTSRQLTEERLADLLSTDFMFGELPEDETEDERHELEEFKLRHLMSGDRSSAYLAARVLLVEGDTELALLGYLRSTGRLEFPVDTEVLDTVGKFNMPRVIALFGELGIPGSVLYDKDSAKKGNKKHVYANERIEALAAEYGWAADGFEEFLEYDLGLDGDARSKPVRVVHACAGGEVGHDRLDEVCARVEALVGTGPR
jgi:putative ATP-dependent endonuclease of the OLD family